MGTPNNQEPRTAQDILRDMTRNPTHQLSEQDARVTGVDVDLLESMFESDIRPHLDYLADYRDILELDPVSQRGLRRDPDTNNGWVRQETWEEVLGRFGQLRQHSKTLCVLKSGLYSYDRDWQGPHKVHLGVYLTRKGKWIFWYAERDHTAKDERVSAHKTVRELCDAIRTLVPDRFSFQFRGDHVSPTHLPAYIPMRIEEGLRNTLQHTIAQRDKRLEDMKRSLEDASERASIIAYGR